MPAGGPPRLTYFGDEGRAARAREGTPVHGPPLHSITLGCPNHQLTPCCAHDTGSYGTCAFPALATRRPSFVLSKGDHRCVRFWPCLVIVTRRPAASAARFSGVCAPTGSSHYAMDSTLPFHASLQDLLCPRGENAAYEMQIMAVLRTLDYFALSENPSNLLASQAFSDAYKQRLNLVRKSQARAQ
eukprot:scaffold75039_cov39-Tisochrysis_lutea.AAC.1